jgi:hypothetical protein
MAATASYPESKEADFRVEPHASVVDSPALSISESDREAFLSSFTAEEDRKIMRKVDKRFLLLIGLMYMLKNVDYTNAATVKVLQVGESRNVLKELNMTPDQYNWVQSIYFVSQGGTLEILPHNPLHSARELTVIRSLTSSSKFQVICCLRR